MHADLRAASEPACAPLCLAAALLIGRALRFDGADPRWADRDRVVVDPALASLGRAWASRFGQADGMVAELATAIGAGAGFALAERILAGRFGRSLVDHRTWVLCDGADLATGPVQEAAWLAGTWRLGRLTVLASVSARNAPGVGGFTGNGWLVRHADSGDEAALWSALSSAMRSLKPTLIACVGEPGSAADGHVAASSAWAAAGRRLAGARRAWLRRAARHAARTEFGLAIAHRLPPRWHTRLSDPGPLLRAGNTAGSTEEVLRLALPGLLAGLPDLTILPGDAGWSSLAGFGDPSNKADHAARLAAGVGAVGCGLALHGGLVPMRANRLDGLDAVLPALRLAACQGTRLVQILVEPSSGAAQAGQRAALRALPNLHVFRPADAGEALECLELAIRRDEGPSVVLVSETAVELLAARPSRTRSARGGYLVAEAPGRRQATLIASGPELHLALVLRRELLRTGICVAVASLPCWELFASQDMPWRAAVLGDGPRVGLEWGSGLGWERWLGPSGLFVSASLQSADLPGATLGAVRRHILAA